MDAATLSKQRDGELSEFGFARVLHAMWLSERTIVLELKRGQIEKRVMLEDGTPVDCTGNVLHETLGKFLVREGKITEEQYQKALALSISKGEQMGGILARAKLLSAFDLFRGLQQNLAHQLLDIFTWQSGTFRVLGDAPAPDSALKVNVPQLVLTGVLRCAPEQRVNQGVAPLFNQTLAIDPRAKADLNALRLNAQRARAVDLFKKRLRIDEVMGQSQLDPNELVRLVYALHVLGLLMPADTVPIDVEATLKPKPVAPTPAPAAATAAPTATAGANTAGLDAVMETYLDHRKLDAFQLLGIDETDDLDVIRAAWFAFAERYAPWAMVGDRAPVKDKAQQLFESGARAFGDLMDSERRGTIRHRRRVRAQEVQRPNPNAYAIKTELLDVDEQFNRGRALLEEGKYAEAEKLLSFAAELDPQNGSVLAEVAWCQFLDNPNDPLAALTALEDAVRIDPKAGIAWFYMGEVHRSRGDAARAKAALERAQKLRPADAKIRESLASLSKL